ncbi:unnamed protein product [Penicillium nalgiovense]|nr:unnamed protein product [Penicillium nalgiovense]
MKYGIITSVLLLPTLSLNAPPSMCHTIPGFNYLNPAVPSLFSFHYFHNPVLSLLKLTYSIQVTMAEKKPNILYIMADQMAAPLLSLHDNKSPIRTPNLDRLADEGVVFDSAYCNAPLCAPSRFAMVSGQLPSKIGAYDNAADLPADVPTYAHYLRREGYHTALAGKMHFCGPDQRTVSHQRYISW